MGQSAHDPTRSSAHTVLYAPSGRSSTPHFSARASTSSSPPPSFVGLPPRHRQPVHPRVTHFHPQRPLAQQQSYAEPTPAHPTVPYGVRGQLGDDERDVLVWFAAVARTPRRPSGWRRAAGPAGHRARIGEELGEGADDDGRLEFGLCVHAQPSREGAKVGQRTKLVRYGLYELRGVSALVTVRDHGWLRGRHQSTGDSMTDSTITSSKTNEPEPSDSLKAFGEAHKAFRRRAGHTQEEYAPLVGYQPSTVASIEQGRRFPQRRFVDRAEGILDAFGVLKGVYKHATREKGLTSGSAVGRAGGGGDQSVHLREPVGSGAVADGGVCADVVPRAGAGAHRLGDRGPGHGSRWHASRCSRSGPTRRSV